MNAKNTETSKSTAAGPQPLADEELGSVAGGHGQGKKRHTTGHRRTTGNHRTSRFSRKSHGSKKSKF